MKIRTSIETSCYACHREANSVEHVPAKCFFPTKEELCTSEDYRKQLITVPSCTLHNNDKSATDEYLMAVIAVAFDNNELAQAKYKGKLLRALKRHPKLRSDFFRNPRPMTVPGKDGIGIDLDNKRIHVALANYARGLLVHEMKKKYIGHAHVCSTSWHNPEPGVDAQVRDLCRIHEAYLEREPWRGENPAVFQYRIKEVKDNTGSIIVTQMLFYEGFKIFTTFGRALPCGVFPDD